MFFTSDSHFHHKNVLKFEDRPYDTIEEMNDELIRSWNSVVKEGDTVHHLGDFVFGNYNKWVSILEQLNGDIILYKGNHDHTRELNKLVRDGYFEQVHLMGDYFKLHGYRLYLTHFPLEIGMRPNQFSISGHIHSQASTMLNQVNVGVDSPLNFNRPFGQPIHVDELISYLDYINPLVEERFQKERESYS